ncbi:hypothetical protein QQS21_011550 [Conoideocrella luteorostrata]|uniref:Methyltransferase n=1 Tax=Conoideocrella luteorostrata TaxID=1105319 RepID=A0AAJ0FT91_9HYPO|nr:hypothetical protein QQS21_011550 [Conoideocrella luteorostrata]
MMEQLPIAESNDDGRVLSKSNVENFRFTFSISSKTSNFMEADISSTEEGWSSVSRQCSESLTESVQNFPEEFGRTYHAYRAGSYAFPNDVPERERLDLQARILMKLFGGKLFFAPLNEYKPPRYILDIATGLGDWAIQMGDLFPNSKIIATDLSPIQPEEVPPNVNFYVEDSSDSWDYSHKFDYIHTRVTGGCWMSYEKQIIQQAFDALEPGGYFESQEYDSSLGSDDGTLNLEGPLVKWFRDITIAGDRCNRPTITGHLMKEAYKRVGFVDVQEIMFKVPLNGWPKDEHLKEIGRMWEANLMSGLSGFSLSLFHRAFGRTPAETEVSRLSTPMGNLWQSSLY